MKKCNKCLQDKELSMFCLCSSTDDGHQPRCKSCEKSYREINKHIIAQKAKKYNSKYVSRRANRYLIKRYNIDSSAKIQMFDAQEGKCYTCNKHFENLSKANVDHNHSTDKIRKLLCYNCNMALGLLKENINVIFNLAAYIREHEATDVI